MTTRKPQRQHAFFRSRWTRFFFSLVALILAVRLAWGWYVSRELQNQVEAMRARGEPTELAEVVFERVPDEENAWVLYTAAMAALATGVDSPSNSMMRYRTYPPYSAQWIATAEASEKAHAQAFTLARQARQRTRAQLRTEPPSLKNLSLPAWNQAKQLANTLGDGAIHSHLGGKDAEAIERLLDLMHEGRALREDPTLTSQLIAIGVELTALHTAQVIAPGMHLEGVETRAQVKLFIADCLDERRLREATDRTLAVEWLFGKKHVKDQAAGAWFLRPLLEGEFVLTGRNVDLAREAAGQENWPKLLQWLESSPARKLRPAFGSVPAHAKVPRYSRWFAWSSYFRAFLERHMRAIAERRMTAVSLAAQLYRADHGRWPEKLADLAPAYLPAIPMDPFNNDGRALGYAIEATEQGTLRPVVWVDVGIDTDHGRSIPSWVKATANAEGVPPEPTYGWITWKHRQYRDLSRFDPPPGLSEGIDDDPEIPDAPGDEPEDQDQAQQPEK